MEPLFSYGWSGLKKFFRDNLHAILYTVILHLVILIVMAFVKVDRMKEQLELGVQVELEEPTVEDIIEEQEMAVDPEWLEQVLAQREAASNRAVNLNVESGFSEDISTEEYVQELLNRIEEAREDEDKERLEELQEILAAADYEPPPLEEGEEQQGEYTGPTTITYEFMAPPKSRGKASLTIPVYRCQGSGLVRVEVNVARDGRVLSAKIKGPMEGADQVCFSDAALDAARSSRFRIDPQAPEQHRAIITYAFVAQ